jgi:DNA-binding LytR/AlgR family response regulator
MKFKLIIDKEADEEIVARVHAESELTREIENLVLSWGGSNFLLAHDGDEMRRIAFSDIECITVEDRKTIVVDKSGIKCRARVRLFEIEELLPSYFVRINKSSIANLHMIKRFKTSFNGSVDLEFNCGYVDYVSRRCLSDVKRRFLK